MSVQVAEDVRELSVGLLSFGLTEYESRTYIALLANGPSTVNQLQYVAGVPRTKVYSAATRLKKKGLVGELDGKPARFQALSPDALQSFITDGERRVKNLKRIFGAIKKVRERHIEPLDSMEEKYVSLGSQSLLTRLKESILKAQSRVRCLVDGWGLHLVEECSDEFETIRTQDVEVSIVAPPQALPPSLGFTSPNVKVRYGKHLSGKSLFVFDNSEVILVNSQSGRGYLFTLNELRAVIADELFEDRWRRSVSARTVQGTSATEDLASLLDTFAVQKVFVEALSRTIKDEKLVGKIGNEFIGLLVERVSPHLRSETFDGVIRLISALMEEEIGSDTKVEYDKMTKIVRLEMPDDQGPIPSSMWYYALAGLLGTTGSPTETLQNAVYPEARKRIIQTKIMGAVPG